MQNRYASVTMPSSGQNIYRVVIATSMLLLLAACGQPPGPTAADLNNAYEAALEATAPPISHLYVSGSQAEQATLARLEDFFTDMTAASVAAKTAAVYAPEGWLYDNLTEVQGVDAIQSYFVKAAGEVEALQVEFLQVVSDGPDYFVRWRMRISATALSDEELISYGMTQFRFDSDGKVLMHRDFWDAGTGIYEYVPVVGAIVQRTRAALAGEN